MEEGNDIVCNLLNSKILCFKCSSLSTVLGCTMNQQGGFSLVHCVSPDTVHAQLCL